MCGVAGILNFDGEPALGLDIKSMTDAIFTAGLIAMGFLDGELGPGTGDYLSLI